MLRSITLQSLSLTFSLFASAGLCVAQSGSATTRLRPIGSPSAVDRFRVTTTTVGRVSFGESPTDSSLPTVRNETAYWQPDRSTESSPIRQTVWMQSAFNAPPLGGSGMSLPDSAPNAALPQQGTGMSIPNSTPIPGPVNPGAVNPGAVMPPAATQQNSPAPRPLPPPPVGAGQSVNDYAPSLSDLDPVPQPSLNTNAFARMENCNLITPPSTYMAASAMGNGCGQVMPASYCGPPTTTYTQVPGTMPAEIASPAILPPETVLPPTTVSPPSMPVASAPARSLISLGQETYAVQVGQGLWGQPVAYVPGQCCRNWLRYFSP